MGKKRLPPTLIHSGWAGPLSENELLDLRAIESKIGYLDRVLVPGSYHTIGNENWILPSGSTTRFLPYVRRPIMLNAQLGTGRLVPWEAVKRLCENNDRELQNFMKKYDVKWFLVDELSIDKWRPWALSGCWFSSYAKILAKTPAHKEGTLRLYNIDQFK